MTEPTKLYAWYGDDFTGSTDVLERLALAGIETVLFTAPPTAADRAAFAHCSALGIAGESRSQTPAWMDAHLPSLYACLRSFGASVNHYKVCSTFDSSPTTGSIGRAIELGLEAFSAPFAPVVVGAPHLGRWVVFGNLFATDRGRVVRIDRHPNMCNHPVTPMHEADLGVHLSRQTALSIGSVPLDAFQSGRATRQIQDELARGARILVFDGIDQPTLTETGRLLFEAAQNQPLFAVGSSGLTYGLIEHWRASGLIDPAPRLAPPAPVERLLVLCGSCSPATARQIEWARRNGFASWQLSPSTDWTLLRPQILRALGQSQSVLLFTAIGPQSATSEARAAYGASFSATLGRELCSLLLASGLRRVLIAGGDTSTHAVQQLGLRALTFAAPLTPGAPLCRGYAPGSPLDGLELVLKGGQMGPEDFFAQVRDGRNLVSPNGSTAVR